MIIKAEASAAYAVFRKEAWVQNFKGVNIAEYSDPLIKRQLSFLATIGTAALDEPIYNEVTLHYN